MFNNVALDVVIGLVFVYLLYSLLVTIIQEYIANRLSFRASFLEKAIIRMLEDEINENNIRINPMKKAVIQSNHFSRAFYSHPLIRYLGEKRSKSKPGYIVPATFSKTVIDLLRGNNVQPGEDIRAKIELALSQGIIQWKSSGRPKTAAINPAYPPIKPQTLQFLNSLWTDSQGDVERFRELLEDWFNETMQRATGWYKKYIQWISLLIGFIIAIIFNVDTIAIAHKLEKDPNLRSQIIQQAQAYVNAHPELKQPGPTEIAVVDTDSITTPEEEQLLASTKQAKNNFDSVKKTAALLQQRADSLINGDIKKTNEILGLGLGTIEWIKFEKGWFGGFIMSLIGWFITALALSLGAPFWFDLLNKLMKVRSSVAPASEASKNQQQAEPGITKIKRVG